MVRNTIESNEQSSQRQLQRTEVIEDWLVKRLATILRIEPDGIDMEEPFVNYGLGSYQGVELAGDLSDWLGFDVPETLVWDYPTIREVALHLSKEQSAEESQ